MSTSSLVFVLCFGGSYLRERPKFSNIQTATPGGKADFLKYLLLVDLKPNAA